METPRPVEGTWELVSPDGSIYEAETPMKCLRAERHERIGEAKCTENLIKELDHETESYRKMFQELKAKYIWYIYCMEHPPAADCGGKGESAAYAAYENDPIFHSKVETFCGATFDIIKNQCGPC